MIKLLYGLLGIKQCSKCSKYLPWGMKRYILEEGIIFCKECARTNFKICDHCDGIVDNLTKVDDKNLCSVCLANMTFACEGCGKRHLKWKLNNYYGGDFCRKCYNKRNRSFSAINIGQKKRFSKNFVKNPNKQFCGIEIECLNSQKNRNCFIKKELRSKSTRLNSSHIPLSRMPSSA